MDKVNKHDLARLIGSLAAYAKTAKPESQWMPQAVFALLDELERAAERNVALGAELEQCRKDADRVEDLSLLVRRLVQHLRKAAPEHALPDQAMDYLRRKGLQGNPLRSVLGSELEEEAKKIYESWSSQPGYVPWVDGGNSFKQDEARRLAMAKEGGANG